MSMKKNSGGSGGASAAIDFALHAIPEGTEDDGYPEFGGVRGDPGQGGILKSEQHNTLNPEPFNLFVPGTNVTVVQVREAVGMMMTSRQDGHAGAATGFGDVGNRFTDEVLVGRMTPGEAGRKTCDSERGFTNSKFAGVGLKSLNQGVSVNSDLLASEILSSIINHVRIRSSHDRDGNY